MTEFKFSENNFDLIRLMASFQVAFHHANLHLYKVPGSWVSSVDSFLGLFPGVPVFFFISGFLISRSYERNQKISQFTKNRVLRLFPGLVVCGLLTIISIQMSGYLQSVGVELWQIALWILGQVTFFQYYDPDFLVGYGIGQANGSLWTIYIEIQFYILIPLIYWLFKKVNSEKFGKKDVVNIGLVLMTCGFLCVHLFYDQVLSRDTLIFRLLGMTFLPYVYMFLLGIIFQRNFDFLHRWLAGKFYICFTSYLLCYWFLEQAIDVDLGNFMNPFLYLILSITVFSFAFSHRKLSSVILKSNDISYGLYIYHMPVVNYLIYMGFGGTSKSVFVAIAVSFVLASLSWVVIEKPSMRFKSNALHPAK